MAMTQKQDDAFDKKNGVKMGSKLDKALDKKLVGKKSTGKGRVTSAQASKVASMMKKSSSNNNGGPSLPTPADNPVTTRDDRTSGSSQGA